MANIKELLGLDYKEAEALVDANITDPITKLHLIESEAIMRALAQKLGEDDEVWGVIGLLHDIDWDQTKNDPREHTVKAQGILRQAGGTDFLVNSVISHCYSNEQCGVHGDKKRSSNLEYLLVAAETLTGLIIASALVQPDKKLASVKLDSLKKKFKTKGFAANCNRDLIRECEKAGIELDEFLEIGLRALQGINDKIGL